MEFILASKSPRRKELMARIVPSFQIEVESIDEDKSYKLGPVEAVHDISYKKGINIAQKHKDSVVISADTIVVLNNEIIGKPKDEADAVEILNKLSGKMHQVITGYSIFYKRNVLTNHVITDVVFEKLSNELIMQYVSSKSPLDKAGAYGVQDNNKFRIIKKITGSYDNVVGFPVDEIKNDISRLLK